MSSDIIVSGVVKFRHQKFKPAVKDFFGHLGAAETSCDL